MIRKVMDGRVPNQLFQRQIRLFIVFVSVRWVGSSNSSSRRV